jgi:hypothetical protein
MTSTYAIFNHSLAEQFDQRKGVLVQTCHVMVGQQGDCKLTHKPKPPGHQEFAA